MYVIVPVHLTKGLHYYYCDILIFTESRSDQNSEPTKLERSLYQVEIVGDVPATTETLAVTFSESRCVVKVSIVSAPIRLSGSKYF